MAKFTTSKEKKAFRMGLFAGLHNKTSHVSRKVSKSHVARDNGSLMDEIKNCRKRNLGALYRNGKYYDTNFVDKPVVITKEKLKHLHHEYDPDGTASDGDVADRFVRHMRRKYGVFDTKGNFLHMLGEE